MAAVTRETQQGHPRNGLSRNTSVPRIKAEYISQLFEVIEGRVTKKLSQEFSRTESCILGALSELDEFLLNPQIRTHYRTVRGTFRSTNVENQGTNEDDSQSDPQPEACIFRRQTTKNSGPEVGHDLVTGVQEGIRYRPHTVTGIQKDIPYCSLGTSSGKQKKARWTTQPHFRLENTLRQLKQTRFCRPLSSWRATANSPTSTTTLTTSRNCPSPSRQQCPPSTGNQKLGTVWGSIANEFSNPQSAHRRRKIKPFPLSHSWWCAADV